ncbi:MAG: cation diffusion facilitator family transporter [Candidatus Methylacidiphilales bacterium]|nr:cation diffusion facilitator family transporter [Candidatus Methylacidiphilales bacterium]
MERSSLTKFAWLSIFTALFTMGLKTGAWWLTGSVGLLSDALESIVNLLGGVMALGMLTVAERPADEDHPYGHGKAEYFSSGFEGALILIAALCIAVTAGHRLLHPAPLESVGLGLAISTGASLANLATALLLLRAGKKHRSITLEANAHHLLTDVWTSVGVVLGVGLVAVTGWQNLDPIIALVVAANILWTGFSIVRRSVVGLMDTALPKEDRQAVEKVLKSYEADAIKFHALWTRHAGALKFVSMHVLVPGDWSVQHGHHLLEQIEGDIRNVLPGAIVFTHLESLDDPASWVDDVLERREDEAPQKPSPPAGDAVPKNSSRG